jgi:chromate transport protein ChrA
MQGARAGALAVLLWASVRLLVPQFSDRRAQSASIALAVLILGGFTELPQYLLLLLAGAVGAALLRSPS